MAFLDWQWCSLEDFRHARTLACLYAFLAARWSTTSIPSTLTALRRMLREEYLDFELPTTAPLARDVLKGLQRICAQRDAPSPAKMLAVDDMSRLLPPNWSRSERTSSAKASGTRLKDAVAWLGAILIRDALLRPRELALLLWSDLRLKNVGTSFVVSASVRHMNADSGFVPRRIVEVTVRTTKTSDAASPPTPMLERADFLCPVAALKAARQAYRTAHGLRSTEMPDGNEFVLACFGRSSSVKPDALKRHLVRKLRVHRPRSLQASDFTLYSIRRGGVTDLILAGIDVRTIQARGRWKSVDSLDAYFAGYSEDLQIAASERLGEATAAASARSRASGRRRTRS